MTIERYFVTTGPELEVYRGVPVNPGLMPWEVDARRKRRGDSLRKAMAENKQPPFKGKSTTRRGLQFSPDDSARLKNLSEDDKKLLWKMRRLEKMPLLDETRQEVWIDGQCYVRKRGETLFQHIPGKTTQEIRADSQRYWDSLAANPPNNVYDVILDLSDPDDHDFVRSLLDSLTPTDSLGYYRAAVDRPTLIKLINKGIKYRPANSPSHVPPDSTRPQRLEGNEPKKKSGGGAPSRDGRNRLLFEGFEGAWPGDWSVGDDDADSGLDYWGNCGTRTPTRAPGRGGAPTKATCPMVSIMTTIWMPMWN